MSRPVKWRRVDQLPSVRRFVPSGQSNPAENVLLVEELEAIRLKDLEGLEQETCAEQMQVSRPTFQRILMIARQKVADSLTNGKSIRIEGGNFTQNICPLRCLDCGHTWTENVESLDTSPGSNHCPVCQSNNIVCVPPAETGQGRRGRYCQRGCGRQGRQRGRDPS